MCDSIVGEGKTNAVPLVFRWNNMAFHLQCSAETIFRLIHYIKYIYFYGKIDELQFLFKREINEKKIMREIVSINRTRGCIK